MGAEKVRRLLRAMQGVKSYSTTDLGDGGTTSYTSFSASGYQTMQGIAQVLRDQWVPAKDFNTSAACDLAASNIFKFSAGSMKSASVGFNVAASILNDGGAGSNMGILALMPSANITGSPTWANAFVRKPLDAASTGGIVPKISWTVGSTEANATTGSCYAMKVALVYLRSGSAPRTAASVITIGSYNAVAAASFFYESTAGSLPSWSASDTGAVLYLMSDQTTASDTGGSNIAFVGVNLQYKSDKLGTQSS